jgi:hypothetical protein
MRWKEKNEKIQEIQSVSKEFHKKDPNESSQKNLIFSQCKGKSIFSLHHIINKVV